MLSITFSKSFINRDQSEAAAAITAALGSDEWLSSIETEICNSCEDDFFSVEFATEDVAAESEYRRLTVTKVLEEALNRDQFVREYFEYSL